MRVGVGCVAIVLLTIVASANAVVFGPTNLSFTGYDDPDCYEPYIPSYVDEFTLRSFSSDVEIYIDCVNEYIEAAENDIKRIREAQDEAHDDAESYMAQVERWLSAR